MTAREPFRPLIRTQHDLEAVWRRLMGPWGFGGHSIWLLAIGPDGRPVPQIVEIPDLEEPPDAERVDGLTALVRTVAEAGAARVAFLRSRPGSPTVTDDDRSWAGGLYAAARAAGLGCEVVHLATAGSVVPLPMDEVLDQPA